MPGYNKCLRIIQNAAKLGRDLTDEELDTLLSTLDANAKQRMLQGELFDDAWRNAAQQYAKDMAEKAMIEKRNAAISLNLRLKAVDHVLRNFSENKELGLQSELVGVNADRQGSRLSTANAQKYWEETLMNMLFTEMVRVGGGDPRLHKLFISGTMGREIAKGLWAINRKEPMPVDIPKDAQDIAKAISKVQQYARQNANKYGAWIKQLEGYITKQSHDITAMRKMGFDAWYELIIDKLDPIATFKGANDPKAFLKGAYDGILSGVHKKTLDEIVDSEPPSGFKGPHNVAKKMSEERVLHFLNSDKWFDYNQDSGTRSLHESVYSTLRQMARDIGLMQKLGPNPEANWRMITAEVLAKETDPIKKGELRESLNSGKLRNQFLEVTGATEVPGNAIMSRRASNLRTAQNWAHLGGMIFPQFTDIANYMLEMKYQGRGLMESMFESIMGSFKRLKLEDRADFLELMGIHFESLSGELSNRFAPATDDLHGKVARLNKLFFKYNLSRWWTEHQQFAFINGLAGWLGKNADRTFADLPKQLRRSLPMYGINANAWEMIRTATSRTEDGRTLLAPELVADPQLRQALKTFYIDRASYGQPRPSARTRATMHQGTQRGTVLGEALRLAGQFKSFGVTQIQDTLGRELYGRGAPIEAGVREAFTYRMKRDGIVEALTNGDGEILGIARAIMLLTMFGYGTLLINDLRKGRKPRPFSFKTMAAALVQGGGMGLYGDFLFGEMNRYGGGLLDTLAGPTFGLIDDVSHLRSTLMFPQSPHPVRAAAAEAFRLTVNNTPFVNMFYVRPVLDYLILWNIQETLSPGSLRRMEMKIRRENNQEFLIRPSQSGLRPLG